LGVPDSARSASSSGWRFFRGGSTPGGGAFVPPGPPDYLADRFATSARAQATVAAALGVEPLREFGMALDVPRIETGAATAVQTAENAAVQETDPDLAIASSRVAYIAGQVDASRQLVERSNPAFDLVIAAELGKDLGLKVDVQALYGTNASGETLGLKNTTGILSVAYTDASPSAAELISKIWAAYEALAGGRPGTASPARMRTSWCYIRAGSPGCPPAAPPQPYATSSPAPSSSAPPSIKWGAAPAARRAVAYPEPARSRSVRVPGSPPEALVKPPRES
jgi:hypothetical protein